MYSLCTKFKEIKRHKTFFPLLKEYKICIIWAFVFFDTLINITSQFISFVSGNTNIIFI